MWWLILAGYAVPIAGGWAWAGYEHALEIADLLEEEGCEKRSNLSFYGSTLAHKCDERALALVGVSLVWPLALVAVVLYYVIGSPFLVGRRLGRREAERKVALRKKYTEQADYLRLLAEDEDDSTMQEILRSGADALVQQAKEL